MRRPIVTDIKKTGRGEGIPSILRGVVIDTRAGARMCRVRLDNLSKRTIKNVIIPTGEDLQSGDIVILANLGQDPRWVIITRIQEGSDLGQHLSPTNQGTTQLHPPNNFTVTGIDGAVKAEWDCWAGNTVCWEVQHNDSATDAGASTRYTRGSYFFYFSTTPVTRYIRVRAVRYDVELNQAYYSAWSAWDSATSLTTNADTVDGFHASDTPVAGWLLALDSNAQWPSEVVPSMLGPHTIGGSTNKVNIDSGGNLVFEGAAGLQFAEIYVEGIDVGIALAAEDTYYQCIVWSPGGDGVNGEANGAVPDVSNDHITIAKDGKYLVTWNVSCYSAAKTEYEFEIFVNDGNTGYPNTETYRTTSVASAVGAVSGSGICAFSANDTVELWVERKDGAGVEKTITVRAANITVTQIGG